MPFIQVLRFGSGQMFLVAKFGAYMWVTFLISAPISPTKSLEALRRSNQILISLLHSSSMKLCLQIPHISIWVCVSVIARNSYGRHLPARFRRFGVPDKIIFISSNIVHTWRQNAYAPSYIYIERWSAIWFQLEAWEHVIFLASTVYSGNWLDFDTCTTTATSLLPSASMSVRSKHILYSFVSILVKESPGSSHRIKSYCKSSIYFLEVCFKYILLLRLAQTSAILPHIAPNVQESFLGPTTTIYFDNGPRNGVGRVTEVEIYGCLWPISY